MGRRLKRKRVDEDGEDEEKERNSAGEEDDEEEGNSARVTVDTNATVTCGVSTVLENAAVGEAEPQVQIPEAGTHAQIAEVETQAEAQAQAQARVAEGEVQSRVGEAEEGAPVQPRRFEVKTDASVEPSGHSGVVSDFFGRRSGGVDGFMQ